MNPFLMLLLSFAVSQIKPEMVAGLLNELATFIDPLIAKRGFIVRQVWGMLRSQLTSPSVVKEVTELLEEIGAKAKGGA